MNQFIQQATPMALSLFLGLIGVVAVLISRGQSLLAEADANKRRELAVNALLDALPPNLCRASFSYDIWVITALFAGDAKTLQFYNIT